jgi:hypothetical protein
VKTTIELPDTLLQRVKILAVHEHKRFKDLVAEILEIGLEQRNKPPKAHKLPKPLKLRGGHMPSMEEVLAIMAEGRE